MMLLTQILLLATAATSQSAPGAVAIDLNASVRTAAFGEVLGEPRKVGPVRDSRPPSRPGTSGGGSSGG